MEMMMTEMPRDMKLGHFLADFAMNENVTVGDSVTALWQRFEEALRKEGYRVIKFAERQPTPFESDEN
jgi:hypothetical protein